MAWKLFLPSLLIDGPKLLWPVAPGINYDYLDKLGPTMWDDKCIINYANNFKSKGGNMFAVCVDVGVETEIPTVVTTAAHAAEILNIKIPTEPYLHCAIVDVIDWQRNAQRTAVVYVWDTREVVAAVPIKLQSRADGDAMSAALRKVKVKDSNMPLKDYADVIKAMREQIIQACKASMVQADTGDYNAKVISRAGVDIQQPISKYVTVEAMAKDVASAYANILANIQHGTLQRQ